jgi:hypothetical protein
MFFFTKYNTNGTVAWSTYYGGYDEDYFIDMTVSPQGSIYMGIFLSKGLSTVETTSNAYKKIPDSIIVAYNYKIVESGYITKFDSSGKRIWASYFNKTPIPSHLYLFQIELDDSNYIYTYCNDYITKLKDNAIPIWQKNINPTCTAHITLKNSANEFIRDKNNNFYLTTCTNKNYWKYPNATYPRYYYGFYKPCVAKINSSITIE